MKRDFTVKITVNDDGSYGWGIKDALDQQDLYMFCTSITKALLTNTHETFQWGNPMYMKNPVKETDFDETYKNLELLYLSIMRERDCVENEIKPILEKK